MMMKSSSSLYQPKKAFRPDDTLFQMQEKQLQQEQRLSKKLQLNKTIQQRLQARHSVREIDHFMRIHSETIKTEYFLFELAGDQLQLGDTSIRFDWCSTEKIILTLGSYSYCLFSPSEYDAALRANTNKDSFLDIRPSPRKSLLQLSTKQEKKKQPVFVKQEIVEEHVDVFGEDGDSPQVIEIEVELKKCKSLKRPGSMVHLNRIINFDGECQEETEPKQELTLYKREEEQFDSLQEELRRIKKYARLEHQLRVLEAEENSRRLNALEKQFAELNNQVAGKDREIARLSAAPRARVVKARRPRGSTKTPEAGQHQLDEFMTTAIVVRQAEPLHHMQHEQRPVPHQPKSAKQALEEVEKIDRQEILVKFQELAQARGVYYQQWDLLTAQSLVVFSENGGTNVGVPMNYHYKLGTYLECFLNGTNCVFGNPKIRGMIDHPFTANYRVNLFQNMACHYVNTDAELNQLTQQQRRDVLNTQSAFSRINLSNVNLHTAFIAKAIEFSNDAELEYRPIILENFPHTYAQEILDKWYASHDSGNGCLVMADLKMPAVSLKHGQGRGKRCPYCELEYIACSNGVLKHAHHVKNCDYLANMSNDERVILNRVLKKRATYYKFGKHKFISTYTDTSLLRLATEEDIARGLFVACPKSGDKVRLNMPVFLAMRKDAYEDYLLRFDSLDTHEDKKNLYGSTFHYQLDCFPKQEQARVPVSPDTKPIKSRAKPAVRNNPKKTRKHIKEVPKTRKEDGFLYKICLDSEGLPFRKSKFSPDGKEYLRDFTMNEDGFGDDMYFSPPPEQQFLQLAQAAVVEVEFAQQMALNTEMFNHVEAIQIEPIATLMWHQDNTASYMQNQEQKEESNELRVYSHTDISSQF